MPDHDTVLGWQVYAAADNIKRANDALGCGVD